MLMERSLWKAAAVFAAIAVGAQTRAAGFDASYNVFQGDLNGDGYTDLYIRSSSVTVIPLDDIPVVIGPPVRDFVLSNRGDRSFDMISTLTATQRNQVAQWPAARVTVVVSDRDGDGYEDLNLLSVSRAVAGARDAIVLSSGQYGTSPRQLLDKTDKVRNFQRDLTAAIYSPNYFAENVPYRVTGVEPATRIYYGSVVNAGNSFGTASLLATCGADFPSRNCRLSTTDPSTCIRTVRVYNERDEYIGTQTRDVCPSYVHVFVYIPGSVSLEADYTVFDQDARESKDILDRLQQGCSLFQANQDSNRLETIFNRVYGFPTLVNDHFTSNSVKHPPAPGDELYDRKDPTFHHYDVRTKVCDIGQPNCNLTATVSYATGGLRGFTHPSERLQQLLTAVDGSRLPVYVPIWRPWAADTPSAYTNYFGDITQRFAQTGYWIQGVQNVTTSDHWVYPGTIIRKVFQEGNAIYVRTHGMGLNRLWCYTANSDDLARVGRMVVAFSNDRFGTTTFETLDGVFVDKFRSTNGYSPAVGHGLPPTGGGGEGIALRDGSSIE
jgi:hypothetical protein